MNGKLTAAEVEAAVERAFARSGGRETLSISTEDTVIGELASLGALEYEQQRQAAASGLGIRVSALDRLVKSTRAAATDDENAALPHWKVEPCSNPVVGAALLSSIKQVFRRYIVLPKGADIVLPLWVLHAWTMNAGDISPFMVLVSPTKRCGKTSVLILLYFMTPKSELASNISASSLFRYIEAVRPTLLIDEADTFVKDNEELRGILDSGHTRVAANIIRNVEVNGEHKPRRFSTWAPKAIATIRKLADTLEDRAVIVTLQRKSKGAKVERLRRRDTEEFKRLRCQAARWAADNFERLVEPDPQVPAVLNDRAADNWRPLLAIADLAGGGWPEDARQAARLLSGEEQDGAVNVELLRDIRLAFGDDDVIRSADLVAKLADDPERPWADWKHGRPLTQKQLGTLLTPFLITSTTVHPPGLAHGKGYRRLDFAQAWEAYCPGQNTLPAQLGASETCKRASANETGISCDFRSVRENISHGSKNGNLSYSHAGLPACTDRNGKNGAKRQSDQEITPVDDSEEDFPTALRRCFHCNRPDQVERWDLNGREVWLHDGCHEAWTASAHNQRSRHG
jgi:putative DNA primase/helicase